MPDGPDLDLVSRQPADTPAHSIEECSNAYLEPFRNSHRVWRWTLRVALPLLGGITGLVLYWIWSDSAYGVSGWSAAISSLPLVFEVVAIVLWTVTAWSSKDSV